jgi:pilus assembly protein Flp/PilA
MRTFVSRFAKNDSGAAAIEYGLIAALISVAIIAAATAVGTNLAAVFTAVSTALTGALGEEFRSLAKVSRRPMGGDTSPTLCRPFL